MRWPNELSACTPKLGGLSYSRVNSDRVGRLGATGSQPMTEPYFQTHRHERIDERMSPKDRPPAVDVFSPQRLAKERQDAAVPPGSPPSPPPPSDAATAFMRHQGNRSDALAGL